MKRFICCFICLVVATYSDGQNPFSITAWEKHKSHHVKDAVKTNEKVLLLYLLKKKDVKTFIRNFDRLKDLETLVFMPGSVKRVPDEIAHLKNLKVCVLSHHSKIDYQRSLEVISKINSLEKLSIPGLDQIPDGINLFRQINYLDLSHGRFLTLPDFFSDLNVGTLDLSLGKNLTEEGLQPLSRNKYIENLDLHSCSLGNFPDGLQQMVSLRYVDMSENNISTLTCRGSGGGANVLKDLIIYRNPISTVDDRFITSCFPALERIIMTGVGETNSETKKRIIEDMSKRYPALKVF